jgi:hypothetical protein
MSASLLLRVADLTCSVVLLRLVQVVACLVRVMSPHWLPMLALVAGKNPFDGYSPSVPHGVKLDYLSPEFLDFEKVGVAVPWRGRMMGL